MKDAYSFDMDEQSAELSYRKMYDAYYKAFKRCGLTTIAVEADTGVMGGSHSHEFMVPARIGEAEVVSCNQCDYRANRELTESALPQETEAQQNAAQVPAMEEVHTPDLRTVEEVAQFLNSTPQKMIKTMIFETSDKPLVVLLRGDHQVNEAKLAKAVGGMIQMASAETIYQVTNAPVGFAGPAGLNGTVQVWADHYVKTIGSGITGANKGDYHVQNVVLDRDYKVDRWGDFRMVDKGEHCPKCHTGELDITFGIEVGHVFILGTKYSTKLNALFTDEKGERKPMIMGCYGIGVSRTLTAVIENIPMTMELYSLSRSPHIMCISSPCPRKMTRLLPLPKKSERQEMAGLECWLMIGMNVGSKIQGF